MLTFRFFLVPEGKSLGARLAFHRPGDGGDGGWRAKRGLRSVLAGSTEPDGDLL